MTLNKPFTCVRSHTTHAIVTVQHMTIGLDLACSMIMLDEEGSSVCTPWLVLQAGSAKLTRCGPGQFSVQEQVEQLWCHQLPQLAVMLGAIANNTGCVVSSPSTYSYVSGSTCLKYVPYWPMQSLPTHKTDASVQYGCMGMHAFAHTARPPVVLTGRVNKKTRGASITPKMVAELLLSCTGQFSSTTFILCTHAHSQVFEGTVLEHPLFHGRHCAALDRPVWFITALVRLQERTRGEGCMSYYQCAHKTM